MHDHFFAERGIAYRTNAFVPGRPVLVFIHGLSGSSSAWARYEEFFGDTYNILTFDLRGHGNSQKRKTYEEYAIGEMASDLAALLSLLQIERCTLVSHSFGSLVALEYLITHPGTVVRNIFLAPTAYLEETRWTPLVKTLGRAALILYRFLPFSPRVRGRVAYPARFTSDWDLYRVLRDLRATSPRAYLSCLLQAYAKEYRLFWREIRVPTLILHGTSDTYIPVKNAARLAKEISGSALIRLEGANHIIVLNNFADVSSRIAASAN